jgi:hypothetical protein
MTVAVVQAMDSIYRNRLRHGSRPYDLDQTATEKHASGHHEDDRLRPASGLMIDSSSEPGLLDTNTDERCGTGEMS